MLNEQFLPKISPCSPGGRWMTFGLRRAKMLGKLFTQLVSKIFNLCGHDPPTSQTDRQTDGQTTCDRKTALCTIVHRAVKGSKFAFSHYSGHSGLCDSLYYRCSFWLSFHRRRCLRDRSCQMSHTQLSSQYDGNSSSSSIKLSYY